jgi:small subunit ribosomal protein S20
LANTKSAQKAMRQSERRAARNQAARSAVRTYVKKAVDAVAGTAEEAAAIVREAVRALDKAAQKGIVHRNAAARRKSRLMSRLHRLSVAPPTAETETKAKAPGRRTATVRGASADKKSATSTRKPAARKPSTRPGG